MPTLKTDQIAPTDAQNAATSKHLHDFLESTKVTCISVVSAFLLIIVFIIGPFKPQSGIVLIGLRALIIIILLYGVVTNCQAIGNMYDIKGLFTLNSMMDIRRNLFTSVLFTGLIVVLAGMLIYKH
jgi:hypothetical protein